GAAIHVYTRIATMADVFCQHVSMGGSRVPVIKTLFQLQQAPMRKWFDPVVLQALLALLPPFTEGMVVTLNDRRHAVVTKVDAAAPCCPQVKVLGGAPPMGDLQIEGAPGEVLNLANCPGTEITAVDGSEVGECLYGAR